MNHLIRTPRSIVANRWNDDFNSLFENFLQPTRWAQEEASQGISPLLDVVERDNEFIVKAEMPGMKKDDIEVSLENARSVAMVNTCAACAWVRKSTKRRSRPATRTVFLSLSCQKPKK
jgi:hypothetical protein